MAGLNAGRRSVYTVTKSAPSRVNVSHESLPAAAAVTVTQADSEVLRRSAVRVGLGVGEHKPGSE